MMRNSSKPTAKPKTSEKLKGLIEAEIKKFGNKCDLNHIDISLVNNFYCLFLNSSFSGNISKWNTSGVKNMAGMFFNSKFNGDISEWDVSSVINMNGMFQNSRFNGDVSGWNVSNATYMHSMFASSKFSGDISDWVRLSEAEEPDMFFDAKIAKKLGDKNPSFEQVKSHFLNLKLEENLQGFSHRQKKSIRARL